jgi:integrase
VWIGAGELAYPFGPYFRMLLATAQRREEVARMRWCDIDLDEKIWTIPKEMTKPGRAHVVPLSPIALRILSDCSRAGEHVFSSGQRRLCGRGRPEIARGDAPISGHSYAKRLLDEKIAKLGETVRAWTIHDLRRTAATQMAKLGVNRSVLGRVLNHSDSSVTGVYDRHQFLSEKRYALELWGQEIENLTSPPGVNVVPLRREA